MPGWLWLLRSGRPSPQARGRSERLNRTLQDRLVNELRVAGIRNLALANAYLNAHFISQFSRQFARAPRDSRSAFVPVGRVDLDQFLCFEEERVVSRDNTVSFEGRPLQLAKQPGRRTCAGLRVQVRRHLDGSYSIWRAGHCLALFEAAGSKRGLPTPQALSRTKPGPRLAQGPPEMLGGQGVHRLSARVRLAGVRIEEPERRGGWGGRRSLPVAPGATFSGEGRTGVPLKTAPPPSSPTEKRSDHLSN